MKSIRQRQGFSLLAVMVVLLIGVILVFAVSRMAGLRKRLQKGMGSERRVAEISRRILFHLNNPTDCMNYFGGKVVGNIHALKNNVTNTTYISTVAPTSTFRDYKVKSFKVTHPATGLFPGYNVYLGAIVLEMTRVGNLITRRTKEVDVPIYLKLNSANKVTYCYTPYYDDSTESTYEDLFCHSYLHDPTAIWDPVRQACYTPSNVILPPTDPDT